MKKIICKDGSEFIRVSRWISRKTDYNITEKHGLYCYGEVCEDSTICVDYIVHKGYRIACAAMYGLESMFISDHNHEFIENKEKHFISTVDMDGDIYDPYYIECDEWGEKFRLYKKVGWYNE